MVDRAEQDDTSTNEVLRQVRAARESHAASLNAWGAFMDGLWGSNVPLTFGTRSMACWAHKMHGRGFCLGRIEVCFLERDCL